MLLEKQECMDLSIPDDLRQKEYHLIHKCITFIYEMEKQETKGRYLL